MKRIFKQADLLLTALFFSGVCINAIADHDNNANDEIKVLPGVDLSRAVNSGVDCKKNYLPVLSHWLANNDMNPTTTDVTERIVTYTIGIGSTDEDGVMSIPSDNENLLKQAAIGGDGKYYSALDANTLKTQMLSAFADIRARQKSTMSSVGTSIDASNATQSSDVVYYSMFEPNITSRWMGNLKKFRINEGGFLNAWSTSATSSATATYVPTLALKVSGATSTAYFAADVYSGWSSETNPNDIKVGGVVEAYALRSPVVEDKKNPRKIYIDNADSTVLVELSVENLKLIFGYTSEEKRELATHLGIELEDHDSEQAVTEKLNDGVNWLLGIDGTGKGYRKDIFGDPMHSSPLVVQSDNSDLPLIFIGTNAGFFHAFEDNGRRVDEKWAFIPKDKLKYALALRTSGQLGDDEQREYGIDGSAVDVEYTDNSKTKHLITFGMRRGGSAYYAIDIGDGTGIPSLKWKVDNLTDEQNQNFTQLGQTWSKPVVTKVFQGNSYSKNTEPVLIFGGGYDPKKDSCIAENCSGKDTKGRAIYVVNALSGKIIKSFTATDKCSPKHCLKDSIVSQLAVLDSDGDGYTDRIYASDTGGNIYRADMPSSVWNEAQTKIDTDKWTLRKLATLGGSGGDDRRFFNPPSIVRARDEAYYYDGLLLGSGDITKPNKNITTRNYFFNLKDSTLSPTIWGDGEHETPLPSPIVVDHLHTVKYTARELNQDGENLYPESSLEGPENINLPESNYVKGWKFELSEDDSGSVYGGEKSLGNAVVIEGTVNFSTYTPFTNAYIITDKQCVFNQSGNSHYYRTELNSGKTKFYRRLVNIVAKDLSVHAAGKNGVSTLRILGGGKGDHTTDNYGTKSYKGTVTTAVTLISRPIYRYFNEAAQ
ncbi:MAG: type IV pilus assembly protein PilY1 [Moritella sp.]|jgi:type IV pilus assembly protein PilY1